MRIYEFAKKQNITSKELIDLLRQEGFVAASHMAVLSPEEEAFLLQFFSNSSTQGAPLGVSHSPLSSAQSESIQIKESSSSVAAVSTPKEIATPSSAASSTAISQPTQSVVKEKGTESVRSAVAQNENVLTLEPMSVMSLAEKIKKPVSEIILQLLKTGTIVTKNQILSIDTISKIASFYNIIPQKAASVIDHSSNVAIGASQVENLSQERIPVVVVIGHVDHGKTTLLDFIRKTRVAAREKGGITQHIGAYEVKIPQGEIVFIDTPGHEAFIKMRQRGLHVADIAVLVVAADDGVMPQTVEAIKQAKKANVAIVVAITKVDKADNARLEVVKRQLTQYGVVPEEWGGEVICIPVSAKEGTGIDKLLEMIVLQSQMLELKTNIQIAGRGYVLESRIEKGRGPVATIILQHGSVKVGEFFVCGNAGGKVVSILNSQGVLLQSVGPSVPVQIAGFEKLAEVGDLFQVVSRQDQRKSKDQVDGSGRQFSIAQAAAAEGINIIVKTDSNSSKEALLDAIENLNKKVDKPFNVVAASVGSINESDLDLASNIGAKIVALHVKVDSSLSISAAQKQVVMWNFDIIYKLLEHLQEQGMLPKVAEIIRKKIGQASVLRVFDIKNVGVIAGCIVKEGRFVKDSEVVALRNGRKIGQGLIKSLQREKKSVKEVHAGFECGFIVEGFSDWMVDDVAECYINQPADKK